MKVFILFFFPFSYLRYIHSCTENPIISKFTLGLPVSPSNLVNFLECDVRFSYPVHCCNVKVIPIEGGLPASLIFNLL